MSDIVTEMANDLHAEVVSLSRYVADLTAWALTLCGQLEAAGIEPAAGIPTRSNPVLPSDMRKMNEEGI